MLKLGVIGLSRVWKDCQTALTQLRHPSKVVAVFDADPNLAAITAKELRASVAPSITALSQQRDVQAILLNDADWRGTAVIDLLARFNKPVFIAYVPECSVPQTMRWYAATEDRGVTLMPALWRRFMPSAIRMKELLATELGAPLEIETTISVASEPTSMTSAVGIMDLVWHFIRREPKYLSRRENDDASVFAIEFPARRPHPEDGGSNSAQSPCLFICHLLAADQRTDALPQISLRCEKGNATIIDRSTLQWTVHNREPLTEQLTEERSELVIMLDHFCRRAVGGLIPVADFNDIARALRLIGILHAASEFEED